MRLSRAFWSLLITLAVLTAGCERTSELIPGDGEDGTGNANSTPTPVIAPPILPPGGLDLGSTATMAPGAIPDEQLAASVVQVQALDTSTGTPVIRRNGAGVVIDTEARLVLTSYVLVEPYRGDGTRAFNTIALAVMPRPGAPAEPEYEADLVAADPNTDLAILRVNRLAGGEALTEGDFDLPAIDLGESTSLARGDGLRFAGFEGLDTVDGTDPQPVTLMSGAVDGFRGDPLMQGRAWIKTDARLPYGYGGGPVFDAQGQLVGIATQVAYAEGVEVGQVRPIELATGLTDSARATANAGQSPAFIAPLARTSTTPSASGPTGGPPIVPADGIVISGPTFAGNALEGSSGDLFDYARSFPAELPALHYEFVAQGIPDGTIVEERWYLDNVLQDSVSSSFTWNRGEFAIFTDSLVAPNPRGVPSGIWRLEVWAGGTMRASSTAYIGQPAPAPPGVLNFRFASKVTPDQQPGTAPSGIANQVLGFFDFGDMDGVREIRWIVFRNNQVVYQSPSMNWNGGNTGTWWVGYSSPASIGAGTWEIEIYLDNNLAGTMSVQLF